MRYSLRRALALDSVDVGTRDPTVGRTGTLTRDERNVSRQTCAGARHGRTNWLDIWRPFPADNDRHNLRDQALLGPSNLKTDVDVEHVEDQIRLIRFDPR
jgi:hypothetical protein